MKKIVFFTTIFLIATLFFLRGSGWSPSPYLFVQIEFVNSYQIPCTSIEIEGSFYPVEIDLGTKTALSLSEDVLKKIKKEPCGTSRRLDFLGNKYETPIYSIPSIKIGPYLLKKIKTKEESSDFTTKSTIAKDHTEHRSVGRIGRDLFSGKNILIDLNQHLLIAGNESLFNRFTVANYKNHTLVPFKNTSDGMILEVDTDLGKKRLVLDTGSTLSAIRVVEVEDTQLKNHNGIPAIKSLKFIINGVDFGAQELLLLKISPELDEIDGFLGMDFIKDHTIYLNFTEKLAYIGTNN